MANNARKKVRKEKESKISWPGSCDNIILNSLQQQLDNQKTQCKMLQKALTDQKAQFQIILKSKQLFFWDTLLKKLITDCKMQHQTQILELQNLVGSSKEMLRQQTIKFKDQVDKLVMSDTIIEQLLVDNDQLQKNLINMKQKKYGAKHSL